MHQTRVMNYHCDNCGMVTPHTESVVFDKESATVWHCLYCGNEKRPNEPGSPNEPVLSK